MTVAATTVVPAEIAPQFAEIADALAVLRLVIGLSD
jgi:hypothetical protein